MHRVRDLRQWFSAPRIIDVHDRIQPQSAGEFKTLAYIVDRSARHPAAVSAACQWSAPPAASRDSRAVFKATRLRTRSALVA